MDPLVVDNLDLFALLRELHSHQQEGQNEIIKCPKCNANHEYKPADAPNNRKDFKVFYSGQLCCSKCSHESSEHNVIYALGKCGHLLCSSDFQELGGKIGPEDATKLDCPTCDGTAERESRCSHGARAIMISGSETCPVCWEDASEGSSMIALACGHVYCNDDFKRLGGKIGEDALLSVEEVTRRRQVCLGKPILFYEM